MNQLWNIILVKKIILWKFIKNKEDLFEELNEEFWIIFDKHWEIYFYDNNLLFDISLEVMPYEVLIHKPLNCKIMDLCIKVDNVDISNLFYYDSEATHNEHFVNIIYGTDCDFTYGDLVEIINDECKNFINYIKEEYDEDRIGLDTMKVMVGDQQHDEKLEQNEELAHLRAGVSLEKQKMADQSKRHDFGRNFKKK